MPQATAADAELILKLYDLRREPEMRKARDTLFSEFWPDSVEDLLRMTRAFGAHEPHSTVLVADREGTVLLVVGGPPTGAPLQAVLDLLRRLLP